MHPQASKFFQFDAVFRKIWQNCMLAPSGELVPAPQGNPGSATWVLCVYQVHRVYGVSQCVDVQGTLGAHYA